LSSFIDEPGVSAFELARGRVFTWDIKGFFSDTEPMGMLGIK